MVKMKALKTFSAGGAKLTRQGDIFDATKDRAEEYRRLELAEDYQDPNKATQRTTTAQQSQAPTQAPTTATTDTEFGEDYGTEPPNYKTDYTEDELNQMNMKSLREIAKNNGVTGFRSLSKSELVFAIRASQQTEV